MSHFLTAAVEAAFQCVGVNWCQLVMLPSGEWWKVDEVGGANDVNFNFDCKTRPGTMQTVRSQHEYPLQGLRTGSSLLHHYTVDTRSLLGWRYDLVLLIDTG